MMTVVYKSTEQRKYSNTVQVGISVILSYWPNCAMIDAVALLVTQLLVIIKKINLILCKSWTKFAHLYSSMQWILKQLFTVINMSDTKLFDNQTIIYSYTL